MIMSAIKKVARRKPTKVVAGIHLKKSSKGFSVHIHSANGNKLAVLTGYNAKANAQKGLKALHDVLVSSYSPDGYAWTDRTKLVKKAVKKKVSDKTTK